MPFAYNWLTEHQKTHIETIILDTYDDKVIIKLKWNVEEDIHKISYERNGSFTLITFGKNELMVPQYFLDVFLEDLKMVLMNQKIVMKWLQIFSVGTGISAAKCCSSLEEFLSARTSALAVNVVIFIRITVSQGMPMMPYLNSDELKLFGFLSPAERETITFEEFLTGLRHLEDGYLFLLDINKKTIGEDELMAFGDTSLFFPVFESQISDILFDIKLNVEFREHQDECLAILCENFHSQMVYEWGIRFKRKTSEKEETGACEETVRYVLENPLLMEQILKQLECFDIQKLRKMNRGVRKCIDTVKPNPRIEKYHILFDMGPSPKHPQPPFYSENPQNRMGSFNYWSIYQCETAAMTDIVLESGDHQRIGYYHTKNEFYDDIPRRKNADLCLNDFEANLRHQNSCMEELSIVYEYGREHGNFMEIVYNELSKEIREILRRRQLPLKTRKFSMGGCRQMEMLEILSAVDKNFLKTIELLDPLTKRKAKKWNGEFEELPFEVDQLSGTYQWSKAEQLISKDSTIITPIQDMNVLHFSKLEVLLKTLSSEDVFYLKTNLLKSPTFQKFKISFEESEIDEQLHELIGEPFRNFSDVKKVWYFRMDNTEYYIHIVLDMSDVKDDKGNLKPKVINFTRVAKEDTPFF